MSTADQHASTPDPQTAFAADPVDPATAAASASEAEPVDPVAALTAENQALKDKVLRTLADMENLRRRTDKEMADARTYAVAQFAQDMLTVTDNLRRALDSVTEESRQTADTGLKSMLEGVELTERDLLKTLERHHIRKIHPQGERFDPNLHQAMFEAEDPALPAGTVTQVVQSGFVIGERLLRPALVGVSKGSAKPS
jgi:molecular chaperone GrpE